MTITPQTAEVEITLTAEPSKSKKGGPNWVAIVTEGDTYHYASPEGSIAQLPVGAKVTLAAKSVQRKGSGAIRPPARAKLDCVVTGNPDDSVEITLQVVQRIAGTARGVVLAE